MAGSTSRRTCRSARCRRVAAWSRSSRPHTVASSAAAAMAAPTAITVSRKPTVSKEGIG
jgi:hypothetical protein